MDPKEEQKNLSTRKLSNCQAHHFLQIRILPDFYFSKYVNVIRFKLYVIEHLLKFSSESRYSKGEQTSNL